MVAAAERLARTGRPAEDATPLVENYANDDLWVEPPETTSIEVLEQLAKGLGDAFERAEAAQQLLFGFAEHVVETTYLGSSTGLRRRGVQPTGRLELNAQVSRSCGFGLGGTYDPRLHRRRRCRGCGRTDHPAWVGRGRRMSCLPGATRPCCRQALSPT